MTAQDDGTSPTMQAASYPGGGREPTLDVPPKGDQANAPGGEAPAQPQQPQPQSQAQAGQNAAELEKARAEAAEYRDRALRAAAELENYRRRAEKERDDVAKYAISGFAREILPVADNLRRALDAQPALDGEMAAALKPFIAGVELTERELMAVFERFGLKKIEPMGQPFDHNFHQAMFEVEDVNQPAGTVVQVMQPGYLLKDRLLRPAMVGVSKGGPARSPSDGNAASANAADAYGAPNGGEHNVDTKA